MKQAITEIDVLKLVGSDTYNALATLFPDYYETDFISGKPKNYYISIVQALAVTYTGEEIHQALLDYLSNPDTRNIAYSLVGSSKAPNAPQNNFYLTSLFFLGLSMLAIIIVYVIFGFFNSKYFD